MENTNVPAPPRSINAVAFAALALALACGPTTTIDGYVDSRAEELVRVIPQTMFGLQAKHLDTTTAWPTVPFGAIRLWDTGTGWASLEPRRGVFDWTTLDHDVALARKKGVEVMLTLALTPAWASLRPSEPSGYDPGNAAPPAKLDDWTQFVKAVATRYHGRIQYYEVWNEPNLDMFYTGDMAQLVALGQSAYQAIKAIDPAARVVSPPFTNGDVGNLDGYMSSGGAKVTDIVGFHLYSWPDGPETMAATIQQIKQVMASNGLSAKPIWNTEAGWLISAAQTVVIGDSWNTVLSESTAAAYIARSYLVDLAGGVERYFVYSWDDPQMGMCEADGVTVKWRVAIAYQQIRNWLAGASFKGCTTDSSSVWTCEVARKNYHGWIIWSPNGPATIPLPAAWGVTQYQTLTNYTGKIAGASSITVDEQPRIFERLR